MNVNIASEDIEDYVRWKFTKNGVYDHDIIFDVINQFYTRNDKLPSPDGGYYVELIEYGDRKIACIKTVRRFTGLGLKEAKSAIEGNYHLESHVFTEAGARAFCLRIEDHGGAATYHSITDGRW